MTKNNLVPADLALMSRADLKSLGALVGGTALLWTILIYPGWLLWNDSAILHSLVAWGLCLVPALIALLWMNRAQHTTPEAPLIAALGGTGIRLLVVMGGGLLLTQQEPTRFPNIFWLWVAVFYFATLALELYLILGAKNQASGDEPKATVS